MAKLFIFLTLVGVVFAGDIGIFCNVDEDGDGFINSEEFDHFWELHKEHQRIPMFEEFGIAISKEDFVATLLEEGSEPTSEDDANQAAHYADENGDGEIDIGDFERWLYGLRVHLEGLFFPKLEISVEDFKGKLHELSEAHNLPSSEEEIHQAVQFTDQNRDGEIDLKELEVWYDAMMAHTKVEAINAIGPFDIPVETLYFILEEYMGYE